MSSSVSSGNVHNTVDNNTDPATSSSWSDYLPKWRPTSASHLASAEKRVLKFVAAPLRLFYTQTPYGKIWTLKTTEQMGRLPVVLLHGMGAGVAIWVQNLDALAKYRQVYALDLLGFGRSSRPEFPATIQGVEETYVNSIESWRKENGLSRFILLGHSFGGYLATAYAIKHPEHVSHLILADPWGFSLHPELIEPLPFRYRLIINVMKPFNIFSGLRAAGPLGPKLIDKVRPDLKRKFLGNVKDETAVPDYIYHCNVQNPSGEIAFKTLHLERGFAKEPMLGRISELNPDLPISFIYGAQSWMDPLVGTRVQELREGMAPVHVELILRSGHHVYADDPDKFNNLACVACGMYEITDQTLDSDQISIGSPF